MLFDLVIEDGSWGDYSRNAARTCCQLDCVKRRDVCLWPSVPITSAVHFIEKERVGTPQQRGNITSSDKVMMTKVEKRQRDRQMAQI